jgi:hypothetical protein
VSFLELRDVYYRRSQHEAFQNLVLSPVIQQEIAKVRAVASAPPPDSTLDKLPKQIPTYYDAHAALNGSPEGWPVNKEGIAKIYFVRDIISAIERDSGAKVVDASLPEFSTYLFTLMFPVLGFVVPWGFFQTLAWAFSGLTKT